jgi:hypothetical protein
MTLLAERTACLAFFCDRVAVYDDGGSGRPTIFTAIYPV